MGLYFSLISHPQAFLRYRYKRLWLESRLTRPNIRIRFHLMLTPFLAYYIRLHVLFRRPTFLRYRYKKQWLESRITRVTEPLIVAAVCTWLTYGSSTEAEGQLLADSTAAAVMIALLGVSFVVSSALLAAGLFWGGAWRRMPTSLPWPLMQKLEALPVLLHTAILSHWSYRVDRLASAPVFAMLFSMTHVTHASILQPGHASAVTLAIFAHHCGIIGYKAVTLADWASKTPGGQLRWLDTLQVMITMTIFLGYTATWSLPMIEKTRKADFYVHARAKLLHKVAHDLVVNFLPAPVMRAVQERAAHATPKESPGDLLEDSDLVAWAYDPACVLQSDIVGFTALGSRVSPQELCR